MSRTIHFEGLKPGQDYYFQVIAKSSDGSVKSAPSNVILFTALGDTVAPAVPSSLVTDFSTNTFIASWAGPDINDTPDFLDYKVVLTNPLGTASQTTFVNNKKISLTLDDNRKIFGNASPSSSIVISVSSRDTSNNISSPVSTTGINPAPDDYPTVTASPISGGFSASWTRPAASFTDYAYSQMYLSGVQVWQGTSTYTEYSQFSLYNSVSVTIKHFDIFNQAGPSSSFVAVTPTAPIVVDTDPPINATGLTITASNNGGATEMNGYITASWTESTIDTSLRGARLRFKVQGDTYYQYENSASGTTAYQINNLIPGFTYEVAVASYDILNNTSSFLKSSPSAITIPYGTDALIISSASGVTSSSIIAVSGTVLPSYVGQVVSGWGIVPGTRVTASFSGSVGVTPSPASAFSGSSISLYAGIGNWQSYITAGLTGSYMKFGTGVNGTQHGIWLDNNNYWYTSGNLRVGSNTSYISWDGQTASISGDIRASSGSFFGNVKVGAGGVLYAGTNPDSGARVIVSSSGIIAYNSGGTNTFIINAINGNIGASAGVIGGWTITSGSLYSGTGASTVGLSTPTSSTDISIWAGASTKTTAPFRVAANGNASMTNAYFSGSILSTNGTIGSWTIGAASLSAGTGATEVAMSTGATSFWAGGTSTTAPFRVSNTGAASFTNAYLSGSITATSGSIGGFSIGASNLFISTGTAGNTVSVYMNATASTSNAGNYPFQVETNTVSGTSSLSTYIRTQLAYSACVTTLNAVPQKISWIKLGTASPGWSRENILQLFSIIPTKYIAEDGSTVSFDPNYDGYTGMVWRNGNTVGGSYTYLVNSPAGDTYLDSNQGNINIRPQSYIYLRANSYLGVGGTSGTPATASSLVFDIPVAGGTANTNIVYSLCPDGRYRYVIRAISSSLKTKNLINKYEIDKNDFMSIKPRLFSWKEDVENRPRGGFILEEISKIESMRPFVNLDPSGQDQSLDYGGMVAMLVDVVQKQQKEIESLTASVSFLINK